MRHRWFVPLSVVIALSLWTAVAEAAVPDLQSFAADDQRMAADPALVACRPRSTR
jgi:hypothetical protein